MILLDTCTLLWLAADQNRLSQIARETIMGNAGNLFVSSISAFEIALKARNGKLRLPLEPALWFTKVLKHHGIFEIPISVSIAVQSVMLPPLHNDPCDRFIIATALENSQTIVTCDLMIVQYKEVKVIW
jgi:PIN domain nuclease of toxin-antitoxin system